MKAETLPAQRGSFHSTYSTKKDRRDKDAKWPRLLDCLICVVQRREPKFIDACDTGEFSVVDMATHERGWFELPEGATADVLTRMIESTFAAPALRVERSLWIV